MQKDKKFEVIGEGSIVRKITRKAAELIGKHKAIKTGPVRPVQDAPLLAKQEAIRPPVDKPATKTDAPPKAGEKGVEKV